MNLRGLVVWLCAVAWLQGAPSAGFRGENLVVRDGGRTLTIREILAPHARYSTIHGVQKRGGDYFVVYGTSELSRGWPPKGGNCGCGIESYLKWLQIRDGKVIAQQEGRYQSCFSNRDGWSIRWDKGKLVWSTNGFDDRDPGSGKSPDDAVFTWTYDPAQPQAGIHEAKTIFSLSKEGPQRLRGWTEATAKHSRDGWMNQTLVVKGPGTARREFRAQYAFIEAWAFTDEGGSVVIRSRNAHGPAYYQKYEVKGTKLLDDYYGSKAPKFPDWVKPVLEPGME